MKVKLIIWIWKDEWRNRLKDVILRGPLCSDRECIALTREIEIPEIKPGMILKLKGEMKDSVGWPYRFRVEDIFWQEEDSSYSAIIENDDYLTYQEKDIPALLTGGWTETQ